MEQEAGNLLHRKIIMEAAVGVNTVSVSETDEANNTARLEAFSDGVFAVAITLLALELKVPPRSSLTVESDLIHTLLDAWPSWFAFGTSFLTILIVWINHHNIFKVIHHTDQTFLLLNGLLLFTVTVIPFATALLGEYIEHPQRRTATVIYVGSFLLMAIAFQGVWRRVITSKRLLHESADAFGIYTTTRAFNLGFIVYVFSFILAFIVPIVALALTFALAVFYALPVSANVIKGTSPMKAPASETGDN